MFTIESALTVESLRTLKLVSSLEMSCTVVIVVLKSMENNQMNREEFWEWLATCPTHKYEATDEFGYVTVTFKVQEESEDEKT